MTNEQLAALIQEAVLTGLVTAKETYEAILLAHAEKN